MVTTQVSNYEELERRLAALDLAPIKVKLMDPVEGKGWSRSQADRVEELYRHFLLLTVTHDEPIVPTHEIDDFWHAHILDTRKYAEDCEKLFGYFVHHFPYFGMRGADDAAALQAAFARTKELFSHEFGASLSSSQCGGQGNCQGGGNCQGSRLMQIEVRPTLP
jgi:hypothetical protein